MLRSFRTSFVFLFLLLVFVLSGFAPTTRPSSQPTSNKVSPTKHAQQPGLKQTPLLYPTARLILKQIVSQESMRDATCWTTVRMMEHFYARRPLSETASFLKIETSKVLLYRIWKYASSLSPKAKLSRNDINAALPTSLQNYLTILEQTSRPANPTASKLKHYHRVTENWRLLLSIAMESLMGEGLFRKGIINIKPLDQSGLQRLANVSTAINLRILQLANQTALKNQHHIIRFSDIRDTYRTVLKELRSKGLEQTQGRYALHHVIKNKPLGYKLALQLSFQNMKQKIRALRTWNKKVYTGKPTRDQILKLLNRISPLPLDRGALDYLFDTLRVGLGTIAIGSNEKLASLMTSPLRRLDYFAPQRKSMIKMIPYIRLDWVTHRLERMFAHHTLVNGDVLLRYGMKTRQGPRFFKTRLLGPDLDAVRDVTLHWSILQYIWKSFNWAKPIDPFAAEVLSERVSEFIWFYLYLAKKFHPNPKAKMLTRADLMRTTAMTMRMRLMQVTPPQFQWGPKLRAKKQALMKRYPSPMFSKLNENSGLNTKPCNAWKAHLVDGKYALLQEPQISYVPQKGFSLVDRRPKSQGLVMSEKKDTKYPGLLQWNGASVSAVDYDNDGRIDLYFTGEGCNRLYRNLGGYKFKDVTQSVGLVNEHYDSHQGLFVDVNNDGRLDLFVVHSMKPSKLYIQQPNGRFVDRTTPSGIQTTIGANTATFFDYDNDGKLDLYIGYFGAEYYKHRQLPALNGRNGRPNQLYRNIGNGKFVNVTKQSGLGSKGWAMSLMAFDVNQDGHMDLFIGNDFGYDELYINRGNGTFVERGKSWGVNDRTNAMNTSITDFNNDGRWDFYVSVIDMFSKDIGFVLPQGKDLLKIDEHILRSAFYLSGNRFYVSDKRIKNLYRSGEPQHFEPGKRGWSWSGVFFDIENDGDEDFYLVNGWAPMSYADKQPNQLFIREGKKYFLFNKPSRLSYPGNSRSAVAADLSGNGRMDIIVNDFHAGPKVFRNTLPSKNHWLKVKLHGKRTNRFGVGARIRLWTKDQPIQMRQITIGTNYLSQSSLVAIFGLGKAKQAEKMIVIWPNGTKQSVSGPYQAGQTITVKEQ